MLDKNRVWVNPLVTRGLSRKVHLVPNRWNSTLSTNILISSFFVQNIVQLKSIFFLLKWVTSDKWCVTNDEWPSDEWWVTSDVRPVMKYYLDPIRWNSTVSLWLLGAAVEFNRFVTNGLSVSGGISTKPVLERNVHSESETPKFNCPLQPCITFIFN